MIRRSKATSKRIATERAEALESVREVVETALADYQPYLDALAKEADKQ